MMPWVGVEEEDGVDDADDGCSSWGGIVGVLIEEGGGNNGGFEVAEGNKL